MRSSEVEESIGLTFKDKLGAALNETRTVVAEERT
jgi:hypothetical protein